MPFQRPFLLLLLPHHRPEAHANHARPLLSSPFKRIPVPSCVWISRRRGMGL
ncbi:hypothetical protein GQ44DRAFT_714167 [Phaeosphaeriaceae sp. PMI808]|nr:hypothetical protein GQ44DRAFT_714167 [Phaeosphaeriaceae sp. PMI808]